MQKREKARARAKEKKRRSTDVYVSEQNVPTLEETVDRTLNMLQKLGNQIFAVSPFSEHFDRWLTDLKVVMSEFESNPNISADDQFAKERSETLANVEAKFEERRREEASGDEAFRKLSDNKLLLQQIEQEYADKKSEIEARKDGETKRLSKNVDGLRQELDRLAGTKTGFFRSMSKKVKAQKEAETNQRLSSAQGELASAVKNFAVEQEKLREEYEKKRQPLLDEMRDEQKEIESQEEDGSLEARRAACEALANSVNALSQRRRLLSH
jgi:uncharacterized phage infection (PIP) family protein YhgE